MADAGAIKAGEAYVEIGMELGAMDRGLANARQKMQAFGRDMRKIGIGLAAIGAPLAAIGLIGVKAAMNYEEAVSKFKAVFKDQTAAAMEFVEATATGIGRSRADLVGFMATLQDTFVPLGFARDEARKFAQQLTELTLDLASFNNVAEPLVLRDLQSAIVGNHETMRKYGVIIMQATLDQELLNMGFRGGALAATEQQKVLARLNIIMGGTADAQGDAARTAGSAANRMRALTSSLSDLATDIGQVFLPAVTGALGGIGSWIAENRHLSKSIGVVTAAVGGLAVGLGMLAIAIWGVTAAMTVLAANPLVLVISAILTIGVALTTYFLTLSAGKKAIEDFTDKQKKAADAAEQMKQQIEEETQQLNALMDAAENAADAIEDMQAPGWEAMPAQVFQLGPRGAFQEARNKVETWQGILKDLYATQSDWLDQAEREMEMGGVWVDTERELLKISLEAEQVAYTLLQWNKQLESAKDWADKLGISLEWPTAPELPKTQQTQIGTVFGRMGGVPKGAFTSAAAAMPIDPMVDQQIKTQEVIKVEGEKTRRVIAAAGGLG